MAAPFSLPQASNKVLRLVMSAFFLIGFIVGVIVLPSTPTKEKTSSDKQVAGIQISVTGIDKSEATVVKVVDGDTLHVTLNGTKEVVRVIGMNTPETVDPRRAVECFGKEASAKAKEVLTGKIVQLEEDPTQDSRDKYGRLLRFVWLDGGTVDYGKTMIEKGLAYEYTYETPYKYQALYKQAQVQAKATQQGLWGATCDMSSENLTEKTLDKDCKDFKTRVEAQSYFESKGGNAGKNIDNLDSNGDGLVCVSLP